MATPSTAKACKGSTLAAGEVLNVNEFLLSAGGAYSAIMQKDGNFVIYEGSPQTSATPIWATGTQRQVGTYFAAMQNDGNFVLYNGSPVQQGSPYWASQTQSSTGAYFLIMQDDGNLVIYAGRPTWASGTAH